MFIYIYIYNFFYRYIIRNVFETHFNFCMVLLCISRVKGVKSKEVKAVLKTKLQTSVSSNHCKVSEAQSVIKQRNKNCPSWCCPNQTMFVCAPGKASTVVVCVEGLQRKCLEIAQSSTKQRKDALCCSRLILHTANPHKTP